MKTFGHDVAGMLNAEEHGSGKRELRRRIGERERGGVDKWSEDVQHRWTDECTDGRTNRLDK